LASQKTWEKVEQSQAVLYLFSVAHLVEDPEEVKAEINRLKGKTRGKHLILVGNKIDLGSENEIRKLLQDEELVLISALKGSGVGLLVQNLLAGSQPANAT
jgi:tRNA modification GTPase